MGSNTHGLWNLRAHGLNKISNRKARGLKRHLKTHGIQNLYPPNKTTKNVWGRNALALKPKSAWAKQHLKPKSAWAKKATKNAWNTKALKPQNAWGENARALTPKKTASQTEKRGAKKASKHTWNTTPLKSKNAWGENARSLQPKSAWVEQRLEAKSAWAKKALERTGVLCIYMHRLYVDQRVRVLTARSATASLRLCFLVLGARVFWARVFLAWALVARVFWARAFLTW